MVCELRTPTNYYCKVSVYEYITNCFKELFLLKKRIKKEKKREIKMGLLG